MKNIAKTLAEVKRAYADCDESVPNGYDIRSLMFRASHPVTRDEAIEIMGECVPSYNEFKPRLLEVLPEKAKITLAREYSVCVYVKGKLPPSLKTALRADEFFYDPEKSETRVWWD